MSFLNELKRRNVLRVGAAYVVGSWLLIQVAETIFPLFGYGDTPARLIVIVLAIAFIPSLIFSWVFEITPEGLKKDADVVRDQSITHVTGKKLDRIILVVLALALAYFAFDKFVLDPTRDAELVEETTQKVRSDELVESYGDKSIAVLPFVNMSSDSEQEYFSDGISEELLNLLSRTPKLRVISRSSAFSYKGKDIDIPTIAEQLNVAYILEGSVRKAGNQVRITAQLIQARSDTHLWSETYDRELENIFAVQDEIAAAITGALHKSLGLELEAPLRVITMASTEAHDAYLRGRFLVSQRTLASMEGAVRELERAITLAPDYALAHAELAMALHLSERGQYGNLPRQEANARAAVHAEQAMLLDPNLAEAHVAKGVLLWANSAYEETLEVWERAIQINPNYPQVHTWMAIILNRLGRYTESFVALENALRLDPLSKVARFNFVLELISRDRLDIAEQQLDKMALIYPVWHANLKGYLTGVDGKWANRALCTLNALNIDHETKFRDDLSYWFAYIGLEREALAVSENIGISVLRTLGMSEDAVRMAEADFAEDPSRVWSRRDLGLVLAEVGDYARARPYLEEMWQRNNGQVTDTGLFLVSHAIALIAIRREAGEEARVGELLAALRDNVRRYREAGITGLELDEGLEAYLSGDRVRGLALIAKAAESGIFINPNATADLQTLYDDPGFAAILAGQQVRQTRERNRFLSIVCNDNPYKEVWQPAEGTCEKFAEEDSANKP